MSHIKILIKHSAFLVHCITKNGGAGNPFTQGKGIYERFGICINDKPEISCSSIIKDDTIINHGRTNFFGPCGLIIKPGIITYASYMDSGTSVETYGTRSNEFGQTTIATDIEIDNAINKRHINGYNELTVKDYTIIGLFISLDDSPFLYSNIVSESAFYNNTKHFGLDYYFIQKGEIFKMHFDAVNNYFGGNGKVDSNLLYQ